MFTALKKIANCVEFKLSHTTTNPTVSYHSKNFVAPRPLLTLPPSTTNARPRIPCNGCCVCRRRQTPTADPSSTDSQPRERSPTRRGPPSPGRLHHDRLYRSKFHNIKPKRRRPLSVRPLGRRRPPYRLPPTYYQRHRFPAALLFRHRP